MNSTERQVVRLLDNAIHSKKVDVDTNEKIDWSSIAEEGKAHKVEALIYSAINKSTLNDIEEELLNKWKKDTFYSGVFQINHIKEVSRVLKSFDESDIPVIVLKGLVIRELYPRPELRTMCDADILVHSEDLDKVRNLLTKLGYMETNSCDVHLNFFRGKTHIEVHWIITNEHYFEGIPELEDEIWKNAVEVRVGESKALSMGDEDLAMHLCLHMAAHIIDRGFGIRQVCDLVLLVEQRGDNINWDRFLEKVGLCGIETFTKAIFALCNRIFNMEIPSVLESSLDIKVIDSLIDDIFSSGVHGKRDMASTFAKELAYDTSEDRKEKSVIGRYIDFLFPAIDDMSEKYDYAKKYRMLAPVAWGHHLCAGVFNSDYSLNDKIKFATSTVSISKKRNELIEKLELKV